jgi:hypothetical protein
MSLRIYRTINIFITVNAGLRWLSNVAAYFLSFLLITSGVWGNCLCLDKRFSKAIDPQHRIFKIT